MNSALAAEYAEYALHDLRTRMAEEAREEADVKPTFSAPRALSVVEGSKNELRPARLNNIVGQAHAKRLLLRVIEATRKRDLVLDHILLVGASGTGKTTFGTAIANELGRAVYQVQAPISYETLIELREVMKRKDILFIDEIHQQAMAERRGKSTSTTPEVLFNVMEDRTIVTPHGVLPFPAITIIGATTDEGMLPDPFVNRFPLRPVLEPYTIPDLLTIARHNARSLGLQISDDAAEAFARASRGVPRQINNYMKNAALLAERSNVTAELAREVVEDLNRTTYDGLTMDMQNVLIFLLTRCRRLNKQDGDVAYQASVNTIATAIGKSRDQKAVQLRIEPYLIEKGYLQVGHGGRHLTNMGIARAQELIDRQEIA